LARLFPNFLDVSSRIENYASRIFDKRMQTYEQLFGKLIDAQTVAGEVMEMDKHSAEERLSCDS